MLIDLYSAEISYADYCIGIFLEKVKKLGLMDNSIIVFVSDHGTHLGEEGCIQKTPGLLNSCVARVPLIIKHPDKKYAGKRVDALINHADLMPTFLSMLGIEGYYSMDGKNAWDLVEGNKTEIHDKIIFRFGDFGAIRTEKWHYFQNILRKNPGKGLAFYDLKKDPSESRNVVKQNPEVAEEMKKQLLEAFKESIT